MRQMILSAVLSGLLVGLPVIGQAQVGADSVKIVPPGIRMDPPAGTRRSIANNAFGVGEHLVFDIAYGVIKAGTATMSIPEQVDINGRPTYHVVTTASSNSFFSTLYKVRDTVQTYIDMDGIFPWRFEKRIREGNYRKRQRVEYLQDEHLVISGKKRDSLYVAPYIQGVLSAFYYVRVRTLEVGKHFDVMAYGDGKIYPLRVLIHKRETVTVPAGTFDCLVVEPVLQTEGIFNQEGRLLIWLTDDQYKMPVLMKSKILVGSIDCRLREFRRNK
ncbi:DUF3108 domain-containing protein [bacterium]|nr:DUF3108 domain-containing protein [bacterium]